jgi:hypothetical protein
MDINFVWLIFAAVFLAMAAWEFHGARTGIKVDLLDLGFSDMNAAQERLRDGIVVADKRSHLTAAISYGLAGLVAVASFVVAIAS